MQKLSLAIGTAALLALGTLSIPAQAQHYYDRGYRPDVIVVPPPPPPRYVVRPGYGHGYDGYDRRHERRWDHRRGRWDNDRDGVPNRYDRDRDGDGVPNRYDRRPNNPYRY